MISVTKSFLPPISDLIDQLEKVYKNQWLTNRGQLLLELESKLKDSLSIDHILITNNGTIPLQIAAKLLGARSEIITTPFSYVATTASIVWEGCTPVFVDIDPDFLTIDETQIESAITPNTTCILATHVFGNPCNVVEIARIAKKYGLSVIYDAAHCFGVKYEGKCIFSYGDISTCSFHATKIFHTGEGGAAFVNVENLRQKFFYSHNFGHNGPLDFHGLGINAKMSELQAAMGLAVLQHFDYIFNCRKKIVDSYNNLLNFKGFRKFTIRRGTDWNYSYYPIIFDSEDLLLYVISLLNKNNIFPRRYFYPSLDTLPYVTSNEMTISRSISSRILCLPLYHDLQDLDIILISNILNSII